MPGDIVPVINLLPWREARQLRRRRRFCLGLSGAIMVTLAVVAGALMWVTAMVSGQAQDNTDLQSVLSSLQQRIDTQNTVFAGYQKQQADFARTRRLHAARLQQTRMLTEVSVMMSRGLTLSGLRYDLSAVQLRGTAGSAQLVSEAVQHLRHRNDIAGAELQDLALAEPPDTIRRQDYSYHIRLQLPPSGLDFMIPEGDG